LFFKKRKRKKEERRQNIYIYIYVAFDGDALNGWTIIFHFFITASYLTLHQHPSNDYSVKISRATEMFFLPFEIESQNNIMAK
jgi:hypothetical protein